MLESERIAEELQEKAETFKRKKAIQGKLEPVQPRDFTEAKPEEIPLIPSPATGEPGSLTPPRAFNMMFETNVGALRDESAVAYLRPETAQGMFVDFKAIRRHRPRETSVRHRADRQIVSQRNHAAQFHFPQPRIRADGDGIFHQRRRRLGEMASLLDRLVPRLARFRRHSRRRTFRNTIIRRKNSRSTRKGTTDIMFKYPFGVQELWGIAARGDYDLTQHAKASGQPMEYFDDVKKKRYVPHVIEPAVGVDRILLAILCSAYCEDEAPDDKGKMETRVVLKLHPRIAPIKVAVFPLLKNKPELVKKAQEVRDLLRPYMTVFYDEAGAIGRRYRRQDEAGTPFGVTIDFDTLGEKGPEFADTVTLRERDTMKQERVKIADLVNLLLPRVR